VGKAFATLLRGVDLCIVHAIYHDLPVESAVFPAHLACCNKIDYTHVTFLVQAVGQCSGHHMYTVVRCVSPDSRRTMIFPYP
jgi:hypothetical protein